MGKTHSAHDHLTDTLTMGQLKLAMIMSRYNLEITNGLVRGAKKALQDLGVPDAVLFLVPGALEIPFLAQKIAKDYDGVICLGAVVKGETAHFEYVCMGVTQGLMQVSLATGIPMGMGVLTTYNLEQAQRRSGEDDLNKGYEAARTVVEMALINHKV